MGSDPSVALAAMSRPVIAEILPAAALLLLLSWWLGRTRGEPGRWRIAGYAAWGLTAGLCLWVDWLALPYVAAAGLLLVAGCGRELLGRAGLVLAGAAVLGAAPPVAYNLTSPAGQDNVSAFAPRRPPGHARLRRPPYGRGGVRGPLAPP